MKRLNPDKLSVEFRQGVTETQPIEGRKYTLTHSDITAELFLTIGLKYADDKITSIRDEVLGEWLYVNNRYVLNVYVYVDGQFGEAISSLRYKIFKRELPLALEAIVYGDRKLFNEHPELDNSPIVVFFQSKNSQFNTVEYYGTPDDYK